MSMLTRPRRNPFPQGGPRGPYGLQPQFRPPAQQAPLYRQAGPYRQRSIGYQQASYRRQAPMEYSRYVFVILAKFRFLLHRGRFISLERSLFESTDGLRAEGRMTTVAVVAAMTIAKDLNGRFLIPEALKHYIFHRISTYCSIESALHVLQLNVLKINPCGFPAK